ncbi:MAG: hypothetical protein ACOCZ2_03165 [Thermodesulfobacteriota bacterium]
MKKRNKQEGQDTRQRGNRTGIWFFSVLCRVCGLKGAYGFLYIVCLYYLLFDKSAVNAAMAYIRRRFPNESSFKRHLHVYRLFVSQGKQLLDRYVAISGVNRFNIHLKQNEEFEQIITNPEQGGIILTSHLGNWQLAIGSLKNICKDIYLLMREEESAAIQDFLKLKAPNSQIRIISPDDYMGGVVQIINALKQGNLVSMMGDRSYGADTVSVSFMNDRAAFPYSAFHIAAIAKVPIIVLLCNKNADNEYLVDACNVLYPVYRSRRDKLNQLKPWVQTYASLLQEKFKQNPYQCFLFYDVWEENQGKDLQDKD